MPEDNDDNVDKVVVPETRAFQLQDNEGHYKGSHQEGSSRENMEKERLADEEDDSDLNKLDSRGTVPGNEST